MALSILWVHLCWLYLLAVDNKPRRIAHAAIFLQLSAHEHMDISQNHALNPNLTFKAREIQEY